MTPFRSCSIVLPVLHETETLAQTLDTLLKDCDREIGEFIIVVSSKTSPQTLAVCERYRERLGERFVIHQQTLPFLGGAFREGFDLAKGSHVLMTSSDLEPDPAIAKTMIAEAKRNPEAIVTASRWIPGGGFRGYPPVKLVCNWIFQKLFARLYGTRATDLTFSYRIFPVPLVRSIRWEELRHPFLLETMVKPLRLGVRVVEVPMVWRPRPEGKSQNPFFRNFAYFRTGLRARFCPKERILR